MAIGLVPLLQFTFHLSPLTAQQPLRPPLHFEKLAHTYSIVAWDSATGDLGVAVQSKFPNVGGIVPWAVSGVGAVATQSLSNTTYGEEGLDLMARGATAEEALRIIMRTDTMLADRQVGLVDARGGAASFTGTRTFDWAGGRVGSPAARRLGGKGDVIVGRTYAAQANIMVSDQTVKNMAETFERSRGGLADRLVAALKAGQAGGGDKRGMQSAALLVVRRHGGYLGANDRFIDIRVYDAPDPIAELERLLALHKIHFFPSVPGGPGQHHAGTGPHAGADSAARARRPDREMAQDLPGVCQRDVPDGAARFHVLGELRRPGPHGRQDRSRGTGRHLEQAPAVIPPRCRAARSIHRARVSHPPGGIA